MKKGYKDDIEKLTKQNDDFRRVVYTGAHTQLVLMSLKPGEDIGKETHRTVDQFFRFEAGEGRVVINETTYEVGDGDAVIVPANAKHNVTNTSQTKALKFYTIYAPPHHIDRIVHATKADAEASDPPYDGVTTE